MRIKATRTTARSNSKAETITADWAVAAAAATVITAAETNTNGVSIRILFMGWAARMASRGRVSIEVIFVKNAMDREDHVRRY